MFQAIAAAFDMITGLDKSASAQYALARQETESDIEYSRRKELAYLEGLKKTERTMMIGAVSMLGILVFVGVVFSSKK